MRTLLAWLTLSMSLAAAEPVDHLALAADYLDRGETPKAITHLTVHVKDHPDEVMTRAYLAELHFRERNYKDARTEFERVVALAQPMTGKPQEHLIHCHTRLMSIAEATGDDCREHLHRGIGLWRLVNKWNADDAISEATLVQALQSLQKAKRLSPQDARVNLYLAEVSLKLKQKDVAALHIQAAKAAPPTGLTPTEKIRLAALLMTAQ